MMLKHHNRLWADVVPGSAGEGICSSRWSVRCTDVDAGSRQAQLGQQSCHIEGLRAIDPTSSPSILRVGGPFQGDPSRFRGTHHTT